MSDGTHTAGIPLEPVTAESLLEIAEQLRALTPDCWHYDLVTSEWLPKSDQGIVYACVRCLKKFVVPQSFFGDREPLKRLLIDPFVGASFGMEAGAQ